MELHNTKRLLDLAQKATDKATEAANKLAKLVERIRHEKQIVR